MKEMGIAYGLIFPGFTGREQPCMIILAVPVYEIIGPGIARAIPTSRSLESEVIAIREEHVIDAIRKIYITARLAFIFFQ
jgi:hypothetical protein